MENINFNTLDLLFILVFLIAIIRCIIKGFVSEIMGFASIFVSIAASVILSGPLSKIIHKFFGSSSWNQVIAFLIIFLIVYLLIKLTENMIHNFFEKLNLYKLDKALAMFLGILEGVIIIALMILVLKIQPFMESSSLLEGSIIARIFMKVIPAGTNIDIIRMRNSV